MCKQRCTVPIKLMFLHKNVVKHMVFNRNVPKTLYCPNKTNVLLQKRCTVPINQKKTNVFQSMSLRAQNCSVNRFVFLVF